MKCGKDIDFDVTKRAVFSLVIPFMLFVIGMFFGAFYDSMFIWILSLFPFYFYTFVFVNLSRLTEVRNGVMGSTYLAFLSLIVLVLALSACGNNSEEDDEFAPSNVFGEENEDEGGM